MIYLWFWKRLRKFQDGESHLLEGDVVTIYGVCDGTTTAETLSGKQVTLPYVDIEYIEQN